MTNKAKTITVGQNLVRPSESFIKMPPTVKNSAAAMTIPANIVTPQSSASTYSAASM